MRIRTTIDNRGAGVRRTVAGAFACLLIGLTAAAESQAAFKYRSGTNEFDTRLCIVGTTPFISVAGWNFASLGFEENDTPRVGEVFYIHASMNTITVCDDNRNIIPQIHVSAGFVPAVDDEHPIACFVKQKSEETLTRMTTPCARLLPGEVGGVMIAPLDIRPGWPLPTGATWDFAVPFVGTRPVNSTTPTTNVCARAEGDVPCRPDVVPPGVFQIYTKYVSLNSPLTGHLVAYVGAPISGAKRTGPPPGSGSTAAKQQRPLQRDFLLPLVGRKVALARGVGIMLEIPPGATATVDVHAGKRRLARRILLGGARLDAPVDPRREYRIPLGRKGKAGLRTAKSVRVTATIRMLDGRTVRLVKNARVGR